MNDEKNEKKRKCSLKCCTCQNYDKSTDFCIEKEIEECSKQVSTDFSQCESYLVSERLVMF